MISQTVIGTAKQEDFHQWTAQCAKLVTPNSHTIQETEQYFLEQCDAVPMDEDDRRMKYFQLNVVMNHCKDQLMHQASEFSFDMTDQEIEKWHEDENAMRMEAKNSSPAHFGLIIRGYYLPQTERNKTFYEESAAELQELFKRSPTSPDQSEKKDICIFFEETTGQFGCNEASRSTIQQLMVFKGVDEEDIQKRSPRFLGYINVLREMGKLPGYGEE